MSKSKDKKRVIFEIYSNNLKWIKEKTNIEFKIDFEKGILCPLCLEIFQEKDLENSEENHLTLEHNPPDSLGGKGNILTCKECNNRSGHKTDIELLTYLKEQEFKKFKPNSKHRTKITNKKGDNITADFSFDSERKMTIKFQSKYSNPNDYKNFLEGEEKGYFPVKNDPTKFFTSQLNFDFKIPDKGNERLASIALLKIGYLLAFEKFGHIFLFNQNLDPIREQILNPKKNIINKPFCINHIFPDEYLGMNLMTKPTELNCFFKYF